MKDEKEGEKIFGFGSKIMAVSGFLCVQNLNFANLSSKEESWFQENMLVVSGAKNAFVWW